MAELGGSPSDYWWLRPPQQSTQLQDMAFGLQMYQAKVKNDLERKQLANQTALTMLELQKGQATLDAKLKLEQGQTELNGLLAQTAKDEAWDNPENQAKFWDIASRYPQVMQGGRAELLFDRTFGAAERSRLRAQQQEGLMQFRRDTLMQRAAEAERRGDIAEMNANIRELQLLTNMEAADIRNEIAKGNLEARTRELELRTRGLDIRLPASVKARLDAAKAKYNNQDYSRDPKENARLYNEEVNSLITPYESATPAAPGSPGTAAPKGKLSVEMAREFLRQANGDKEKARQLARDAGYDF